MAIARRDLGLTPPGYILSPRSRLAHIPFSLGSRRRSTGYILSPRSRLAPIPFSLGSRQRSAGYILSPRSRLAPPSSSAQTFGRRRGRGQETLAQQTIRRRRVRRFRSVQSLAASPGAQRIPKRAAVGAVFWWMVNSLFKGEQRLSNHRSLPGQASMGG